MSEGETESIEVSEIESEPPVVESIEDGPYVKFDEEEADKPTESVSQSEKYEGEEYETGSEEFKEEIQEAETLKKKRQSFFLQQTEPPPSFAISEGSRKKSSNLERRDRKSTSSRHSPDDIRPHDGSSSVRDRFSMSAERGSISRRKTVQISKEVIVAPDKQDDKTDKKSLADDDDSGEWACPLKPLKPKIKVVPPPHQLWPVRKFNHYVVTKIIIDALPRFFIDHVYHPTSSMENLRMALTYILRKVYQLRYDRRKLVVIGRLHENLGQSSLAIARFFWNPETDAYAHYTLQKPGFIVGVVVFAIYMD